MAREGVSVSIDGIEECVRAFNTLEVEARRNYNGQLRRASRRIADKLIPTLGRATVMQQRLADAARPKSDRYVVVAVPGRIPQMSGVRRQKRPAKTKYSIVFGVEDASPDARFRKAGPRGGLVQRRIDAQRGRWIAEYQRELASIMSRAGLI